MVYHPKSVRQVGSALSDSFFITNGVRKGGILSPLLFNVYMDALSSSLSNTPIGCSIGGVMVNHIMYADDLVIISPSAKGLQRLLDICADYSQSHDNLFNYGKTVCMYMPANSSRQRGFFLCAQQWFIKKFQRMFALCQSYTL